MMTADPQSALSAPNAGSARQPCDRRGLLAVVPLAAAFLIGITLCDALAAKPVTYAVLAAILGAAACLLSRFALTSWIAIAGFALAGLSLSQTHWYSAPAGDIAYYAGEVDTLTRLRLRITHTPRLVAAEAHRPPVLYARAAVTAILCKEGWQQTTGVLLLRASGDSTSLQLGDEIEALGALARTPAPGNPGEFNMRQYHRFQGVYGRFQCELAAVHLLRRGGEGWLDASRRLVRSALAAGFPESRGHDLALARALLLGDSDPALGEVREDFRKTGTTHHLAISGTHIAILTLFVYGICRLLAIRPARAALIGMLFTTAYGLVVIPSPPVLRSVLLCLAVGTCLVLRRRVLMVQLLALAALLMLIVSPLDAFSAGFQLSFVAVLGLMLLANPLAQTFRELQSEHVRVARRIRPPAGSRALWLWCRDQLILMLAAGIVAWLVSMPLIAWHFRQLNPWAIPASILLGAVVAATLITGLLKVVLTLLCPPAAPLLAAPVALCADWMRQLVHVMAAVPATDAAVYPMPVWLLILYYLCLLFPLLPSLRGRPRAWLLPILAALLATLLPLLAMIPSHDRQTRLTCLAVGAGSCAVLESPGAILMVDCGSSSPSAADRIIRPFLRHRSLRQLDALYLTHGDADHVSALGDLLPHVRLLVLPADAPWTRPFRDLAAASAVPVLEVRRGDTIHHRQTSVTILGPDDPALQDRPNDASLILLIESAGRRILFTGDIGAAPRHALAQSSPPLLADILIAPHHGAVTPGTEELLQHLRPQFVLSSDSSHLSAGQQKLDTLVPASSLFRTGRQGAITAQWTADLPLIRIHPFRSAPIPIHFP